MNYNDQMRTKLKSNILVVSVILGISLIFTGIKLYQILYTDLIGIQQVMILKDYFPIIASSFGILALLVSVLTYYKFDNLYPKHQVLLFVGAGMFFMPYTFVLFVIGIMKYMEKETFKKQFYGGAILGMVALGFFASLIITPLGKIEAVYLNEYVVEGEYIINDDNYVLLKATGLTRGNELVKVIFDATITFDSPNLDIVGTEYVQISMNTKRTCIIYAFDEAQDNYQMKCEVTTFNEAINYDYTINDFINFEDFYLEFGNVDYDHTINRVYAGGMQITDEYMNENVYEKYQGD